MGRWISRFRGNDGGAVAGGDCDGLRMLLGWRTSGMVDYVHSWGIGTYVVYGGEKAWAMGAGIPAFAGMTGARWLAAIVMAYGCC